MNVQQAAHAFVGAFIDQLAAAGVGHVCVCPGSRSTPLAMLCADHPALRVWLHVDERSAAFFALGLAKAAGEPVALVATSGTAVVNFMPAVVEAFFARVPLILLTADRPRELRDVGANQTIDQVRLYGTHVKWSVDMPLPEASETMLRYARMAAARAVATAKAAPAGPVHLNFPLREPLVPRPGPESGARAAHTQVVPGMRTLGWPQVEGLARSWAEAVRGVVVCGPDTPPAAAPGVVALADKLGWPVLADPLSGLRTMETAGVVDAYDVFLRDEAVSSALAPELIVRFGAMPVSKWLLQYMERYRHVPQVVVDEGGGWRDPVLSAATMLHVDAAWLCEAVGAALGRGGGDEVRPADEGGSAGTKPGPDEAGRARWLEAWRRLNVATRTALRHAALEQAGMFEGRVFQELADWLPQGAALYVGNSMPIRDMDAFFPAVGRRLKVLGNRGASGIDGVVSSALGASAAWDGPVVLVLGDLSFYHDLNGLLAAKLHGLSVTIVVVNNDGGGIFSFLPQADEPRHFERLFGTPVGLDFEPVVRMYGGRFVRVSDWPAFRRAVQEGVGGRGLHVVEVPSDRSRNVVQHRDVFARACAAAREALSSCTS